MLRNLILGLVMVVAVFFAVGFVLPDKVHVERSEKVQAPASQIFAVVNGFRQFDKWSPWSDKDPQMKVQISGPPLGVGAHYEWSGNQAVGAGSQEIVRSTPESQVKTRLKFSGFEGASQASFDLEPDGELTKVTWSVDIPLGMNPIAHYFGLTMKGAVGADYERGLNKLRGLVESGSKTDFAALHGELVELKPQTYAYVSGSSSTDSAAIAKALAAAYAKVNAFMTASGLKGAAQPISVTRRWDPKANVYEFDAGIPVDKADATAPDTIKGKPNEVKIGHSYAGTALKAEHRGAYKDMGKTYALIDAYKAAYALQDNGLSWEQYIVGPGVSPGGDSAKPTPEAQLLTDIYVPVK